MKSSGLCLVVALCGVFFVPRVRSADELPPIGFDALLGFEKLPLLVDWPASQDSSYHRGNINQDAGNFIRVESNGDQVLMEADGPGVIYRLWSTGVVGMQMSEEARLRFYFDWESSPRLDLSMSAIFGAKGSRWPFVPPLSVTFESGVGGGEGPCNLCYVPIPFAKHLKIVGRNVMFYHVNYHKLPPDARIESFSLEVAEKHRSTLDRVAKDFADARPTVEAAAPEEVRDFSGSLGPGEAHLETFRGEGSLRALKIKIANPTGKILRGAVLEVAFEEPEKACVRVPVGDFFGSGCGDRRFRSIPTGMADEGYYALWPMPFRKLCVVALRNEADTPMRVEALHLEFLRARARHPDNMGYFHARYVSNPDIPMGEDYRILDVTGRGKFVGANVTLQNARGAQGIFFLEGDEKIYVDSERFPSRWLGTGTEDYFNGAYFWNAPDKAIMARPYGGLTFLDWGIGRVCAYRWHITDFVSFQKSIRVDLEHGGVSDWPANYQSVAYYYLDRPSAQPALPALAARLPRTPLPPSPVFLCSEPIGTPDVAGRPMAARKFSELDPQLESSDTLLWGLGRAGDKARLRFKVPGEDEFSAALVLSGGPDHGVVSAAIDGKPVAKIDARRPEFTPWFSANLGEMRLPGGEHELVLELEAGGPSAAGSEARGGEAAASIAVGIVALQLKPHSRLIDQWSVIGNWPCPKEGGWDVAHEPEKEQDLSAVYKLPGGGEARWREYKGDYVGLAGGDWQVAYGLTYIESPDDRRVACFLGKDDGLKVWLDGKTVFDRNTWSHGIPDLFFTTFELKKGYNQVLVKCSNHNGAWAFVLRPGDPDRKLRFARKPE